MLYRVLLPVLLLASSTTPAPQDVTNSDITYVKVKPLSDSIEPETTRLNREAKIETIPVINKGSKDNFEAKKLDTVIQSDITSKHNRSEISAKHNRTESQLSESSQPEIDIESSGSDLGEAFATDDTQTDSFPSDTVISDRKTKIDYTTSNYDSGETTETAEGATEKTEDETAVVRKYPSSRSYPKLTHKRKPNGFSFTANLIEKSEKRKFRSTCKCMRIWNCPKLQISVGRCAEEFFLCCF